MTSVPSAMPSTGRRRAQGRYGYVNPFSFTLRHWRNGMRLPVCSTMKCSVSIGGGWIGTRFHGPFPFTRLGCLNGNATTAASWVWRDFMRSRKRIDRKKQRGFILPLHAQLRTPEGLSPLAEFIRSCGKEVSAEEAIHEYQQEWCDHPRKEQRVISSFAEPGAERFEYNIACGECGLIRPRKGRAPNAA